MRTLVIRSFALLMIVALFCSPAMAQFDFRSYYGRPLPYNDLRCLAVISASPNAGLNWAMSMRGQRIGNGECTELAKMHLMYSRALPGNFSDYRNYIWGGMSTNGYRPGDILQFEYCKFSWKTSTSWGEITMDHHTAIVVSANGSKLQILQQNAPFGGPVRLDTLDLSTKTQGRITVWRPVTQ